MILFYLYVLVEDIKNNSIKNCSTALTFMKIYDSLLETPSSNSRTPPTASSGSGSVSHNSATII